MIQKLASVGIPAHILNAIILTQTNQQTRIIGSNMAWIPVLRGVRQGSPLGPFLFNVYVNDIKNITTPPPRMYLDDMAFIIQYYQAIACVYRYLQEWCQANDMSLNLGPNKTAIVLFSNKRTRPQYNYQIPTTASYKYLGKQIQLRANQTVHLNSWKTAQAKLRLTKFRNTLNMIARAAFACPHSFAQFRTALISVTTGNLYGLADHTTLIYEDYARGELEKWEVALRKTLKKVLRLPKVGFPNDLLHRVTGVPSIAALLNQKIVGRIKMLYKGLEDNQNAEEKKLTTRNLEKMTLKQITALNLTTESSISQVKLKKREMEARFWTNIDNRLPNFPERQFNANTYGNTDSILSRSLTAKEIYNTLHQPTQHLAYSLTCRICHQAITRAHPCLYTGQPTGPMKAKIADLYYNWDRYHTTSLQDATTGTNLHTIARVMMTSCSTTASPS